MHRNSEQRFPRLSSKGEYHKTHHFEKMLILWTQLDSADVPTFLCVTFCDNLITQHLLVKICYYILESILRVRFRKCNNSLSLSHSCYWAGGIFVSFVAIFGDVTQCPLLAFVSVGCFITLVKRYQAIAILGGGQSHVNSMGVLVENFKRNLNIKICRHTAWNFFHPLEVPIVK